MVEAGDLQDFIADCEWKTRKILRESNRRKKESARLIAAKERVELLKQSGTKKIVSEAPYSVTETKVPNSSEGLKSSLSDGKGIPKAVEWKGRDKIIHDACEVIKSFSEEDVTSLKKSHQTKAQKEKTGSKLHASLYASPFNTANKGTHASASTKKVVPRSSDRGENAEPAMVTRRTIERDFYIMSKRRSKPRPKRRQRSSKNDDDKPELKSLVLWKKYRCDDRIMEAKRKKSERLCQKFERLQSFDGAADDSEHQANSECVEDSSSSSSDEEEERAHALHDLLDAHVADENRRSQRRTNKMLSQINFKPDVQAMWNQLEEGGGNRDTATGQSSLLENECQLQSVPLHKATKKYIASPSDQGTPIGGPTNNTDTSDTKDISRYVSPYKERGRRLQLINNEPLLVSSLDRTVYLTISISYEFASPSEDPYRNDGIWVYEIYDPCDGSILKYAFDESEFKVLKSNCTDQTIASFKPVIEKVVHWQEVEQGDPSFFHVVVVSVDGIKISATIYRSRGPCARGIEAIRSGEHFEPMCTLQVCEILRLLEKHHVYRLLDESFWMSETNASTIWNPLIDLLSKDEGSVRADKIAMSCSILAYESLIGLKRALGAADGKDSIERMFLNVYKHGEREVGPMKTVERIPPLSMRISNHSPYSSTLCPGHAAFGKQGVWRLSQPITEVKPNSSFPDWPSAADVKYPSNLDTTQATAFFYSKNLGPNKGTSITALCRTGFESPILAPYCYATDRGFISPPFSQHELVNGIPPTIKLPCKSLLECPVVSRFDTLLPSPVILLDPSSTEGDWIDAPRDFIGNVFHTRYDDDFNKDGFRVKAYAHQIDYDDAIKGVVYGISEKAASPNRPVTTTPSTHKSTECCTRLLSKRRTATDYHYMAESDGEGTRNVTYFFTTHMKAYKPIFVSRKSIVSYHDEEKFLLATREAEAKRRELALKIQAAEEIAEARLQKKMEEVHQSMKITTTIPSDEDSCTSVTVHSQDETTMVCNESSGSLENQSESMVIKDYDELDHMTKTLLNNTTFLRTIAGKLNIPDDRVAQLHRELPSSELNRYTSGGDDQPSPQIPACLDTTPHRPIVPKLRLDYRQHKDHIKVVGLRSDGWKKLPRADTLIGEFNLTTRKVEKNWRGAKFNVREGRTNFFSVNAVHEIGYKADPEIFNVKTKTMFISDLTTERLRLSKSKRHQKQYEISLLSEDQKLSLQEIMQIPVSESSAKRKVIESSVYDRNRLDDGEVLTETKTERESSYHGSDMKDLATTAILAVKNHNRQQLERIIDTEGLSVETRDQHGNTLFILACQQGSKKLAKFLLRRGADMNTQNNGGNTALHYLYEYHHKALAEYLLRKGANDSLRNAEGLTVFEGVHQESDMES